MTYRVYVIQSREGKFYIGLSDDVGRRVDQHNIGESRWTRGKGPWRLIWQSAEMNLSSARKLELLLKRQKGGDGFYRLIGLSRLGSYPAPAGSLVQQRFSFGKEALAAIGDAGKIYTPKPREKKSSVAQW